MNYIDDDIDHDMTMLTLIHVHRHSYLALIGVSANEIDARLKARQTKQDKQIMATMPDAQVDTIHQLNITTDNLRPNPNPNPDPSPLSFTLCLVHSSVSPFLAS